MGLLHLGLSKVAAKGVQGHIGLNLEGRTSGFYDFNFQTQQYTKISSKSRAGPYT